MSSAAVTEAGQFLSLTCRVDVVEYLTVDPQVEWRQPDGSVVTNTGNPSAMFYNNLTLNLNFSSLLTSHAGEYWCQANINLTRLNQNNILYVYSKNSTSVYVQCKLVHLLNSYLLFLYFPLQCLVLKLTLHVKVL